MINLCSFSSRAVERCIRWLCNTKFTVSNSSLDSCWREWTNIQSRISAWVSIPCFLKKWAQQSMYFIDTFPTLKHYLRFFDIFHHMLPLIGLRIHWFILAKFVWRHQMNAANKFASGLINSCFGRLHRRIIQPWTKCLGTDHALRRRAYDWTVYQW